MRGPGRAKLEDVAALESDILPGGRRETGPRQMMRLLVAPDSFKGSLTAGQAAEAIHRGALVACSDAAVDLCPLSDGGEGFASVVAAALGGHRRHAIVTGPLGDPLEAPWYLLPDGTAVIESAAAVGLELVPAERRAPLRTTTFGVGQLVRAALDSGAGRVVLGLGGTATTDAGAGMAQALGAVLEGAEVPVRGEELAHVRGVDLRGLDARLRGVPLVALTDVDGPLAGPEGAARVYGPQKGASSADVQALDRALSRFAAVAGDPGLTPGDGAAGGLGYGLRVLLGAERRRGIDFVLDAVGFDARLVGVDLVLTGEGRLDAQSARGKVVSGVVDRCQPEGLPVVALVGAIGAGGEALVARGLTAAFALTSGPMSEAHAMEHADSLLTELAASVVRTWAAARRRSAPDGL